VSVQQLLPGPRVLGDLGTDRFAVIEALAELYTFPRPNWVRASMVATLDGSATGDDALSGSISSPADRAVLSTLRGVCDVVLAGAGTVRHEDYLVPRAKPRFAERRRRAGQPPAPPLAVVTRSGNVPAGSIDPGSGLVITCSRADVAGLRGRFGTEAVIVAGEAEVDVAEAIAALAGRGLGRVQLEGGPTLLGQALTAGVVDELCLSLSPTLVAGDGPRIAHGSRTLPARNWQLAHLLSDGSMLMLRYLRRSGA